MVRAYIEMQTKRTATSSRCILTWLNAFMERRVRIKVYAHIASHVDTYIYRGKSARLDRKFVLTIWVKSAWDGVAFKHCLEFPP